MSVLPMTITIPRFVRRIKVSDKQRAYYFEWTGLFIKGKAKTLPISFYKNKFDIPVHTKIEDLKEGFVIGCVKNGKVVTTYRDSAFLPSFEEMKELYKNGKFYLCKTVGNKYEPIICNPKKVGTPKFYLIKGQDIYSGNLREHFKGMVMDAIKQSYLPYVKDIPVIDSYPVKIECELHETIKNYYDKSKDIGQRWDVDNYVYPYMKAFPDLLVSLKKLRDDDRLHLPSSIPTKFVPIDNHDNRKLVFVISIDDRPEIKDNPIFQEYHRNPANFERNAVTGETEDNDLRDLDLDIEEDQLSKQY